MCHSTGPLPMVGYRCEMHRHSRVREIVVAHILLQRRSQLARHRTSIAACFANLAANRNICTLLRGACRCISPTHRSTGPLQTTPTPRPARLFWCFEYNMLEPSRFTQRIIAESKEVDPALLDEARSLP